MADLLTCNQTEDSLTMLQRDNPRAWIQTDTFIDWGDL